MYLYPHKKYVQMYMMSLHICNVYIHIYMHICAHTIYSVTVCLHMNRSYGYSILQQMFINSPNVIFCWFFISGTAIQLNLAIYSMDAYNHTTILNYTQQYYEYSSEWYVCIFATYIYIYIFFLHSNTMKVYEECMYVYTEIDRSFLSIWNMALPLNPVVKSP